MNSEHDIEHSDFNFWRGLGNGLLVSAVLWLFIWLLLRVIQGVCR